MKVFISSVIVGFERERLAVQEAAEVLGHEVIRAEDFPASDDTPRTACLSGVRGSDLVVVIAGERYGAPQEGGLSATHEEFLEARRTKPILAFVQNGISRESRQSAFVREVEDWAAGGFSGRFDTAEELHRLAIRAIAEHEKKQLRGVPDEGHALERAKVLLGETEGRSRSGPATLDVAAVGAPPQQIIRPRQLESSDLETMLSQAALFGPARVFDRRLGTDARIERERLVLSQDDHAIELFTDASIVLRLPIGSEGTFGEIVEEEARKTLTSQIEFIRALLEDLDNSHRVSHVAIVARISSGSSFLGWRTRKEVERSPNYMSASVFGHENSAVHLQPALVPRNALGTQREDLVDDLLVLLRRQFAS